MNRVMNMFVRIAVVLYLVQDSYSARILASVSTASYSHQIAFRPIWKALAKRGHEIVLMTTDPMEETENIRQIDMSFSYEILKERNFNSLMTNEVQNSLIRILTIISDIFHDIIFKQIKLPEVQQIINNKSEHFDLIMIELVFPIHLGLVEKIKAPVIALSSSDATPDLYYSMGSSSHPLLEAQLMFDSFPMTLWERLVAVVGGFLLQNYNSMYLLSSMKAQMRETFGENCRSLEELMEDIDMLFVNTNPFFHNIRPLSPNTISFGGGSHIESKNKPLPEDLKTFLDSATDGFIYFSLGTNVRSNLLNENLKRVFLETFSELPYKILWKFENTTLKSDNLMTRDWVPQDNVLGHPNIKLFITQCGLHSTEEAISKHVPMVAIPFIGDQLFNARILVKKEMGLYLDYSTLTKESLKEAIIEVITNTKYKKGVTEMADLFTDVEMTGLEKVVWWTEYVIRNKGAKHLKIPVTKIPFYQRYCLDVILAVIMMICTSFFCIKKSFSVIRRICFNKKKRD
ncbi:hypothetical protein WA026_014782 [Henosepilachna vigintioctopunctata]|uniref:UDP-glucuronosyltransferase n=1 Tax=Henosepilachna vigintioctopunctata TaxID=420089 RepID=A0AAW1UYR0_9CUCU